VPGRRGGRNVQAAEPASSVVTICCTGVLIGS